MVGILALNENIAYLFYKSAKLSWHLSQNVPGPVRLCERKTHPMRAR